MEMYVGSFDVLPPDDGETPKEAPEGCALCGAATALRLYLVDAHTDSEGRHLGATELAGRWFVCEDCGQLLEQKELRELVVRSSSGDRALPRDVVLEFAARARPAARPMEDS